ncbi:MAG: DUF2339 domain-containing protein, partial [Deltaproteobacteria bacterium]
EWTSLHPAALLVAGIVFAQSTCSALLYDDAAHLGLALALCALPTVLLLRHKENATALAVPLLLAFALLAVRRVEALSHPYASALAAGTQAFIYAVALARAIRHAPREPSATPAIAITTGAGLVAMLLAATFLLPAHPVAVVIALLSVAIPLAALAEWTDRPWVLAVAGLGSFSVLFSTAHGVAPGHTAFLAATAAWGAVHLAAAHRGIRQGRTPLLHAMIAAGGALGFVAAMIVATRPWEPTLRAVCATGAGVALFTLGARLRSGVSGDARTAPNALLGAALACFTLGASFAFSGATVSLAWAVMAAVTAYLAARSGDAQWRSATLVLFGLVIARVVTVDAMVPLHDRWLFDATRGARGALEPVILLNPRAAALAGTAAALLVSARAFATRDARIAAGLATAGYAMALALCITEVSVWLTTLPALPGTRLDASEFEAYRGSVYRALAAQANRRAVGVTIVMGLFGAVLLAAGFVARSVLHRWLGLIVLAATVLKLASYDIWQLPRLDQILVLMFVGAVLLGAGFLYARFGKRLLGMLRVGGPLALVFLVGGSTARADDVDPSRFVSRVDIQVPGAGYMVCPVLPALERASHQPGLGDVRLASPSGAEVPCFVRDEPWGVERHEVRAL